MAKDLLKMAAEPAIKSLRSLGFTDCELALKNLKLLSGTPFKKMLNKIAEYAGASPDPEGALNNLEAVSREIPAPLLSKALRDPLNIERIITVCGSSPFLSNILAHRPETFEKLFVGDGLRAIKDYITFMAELKELPADIEEADRMGSALRLYRQKEYLRIGARDLLGIASLEETTAELSDLADASLDRALEFSMKKIKASYGVPYYKEEDGAEKEAAFVVIGLGKLGGRELNFSSDIDIIYIYSSDKGETNAAEPLSLHAFFVKLAAMINRLISGVTSEGIVFRIDLDLRPEGRSGDMANSLRSAEVYYESWGQSWERAAMIKARPVAGSKKLGEKFLSMIRPFVYRRNLDFTALEEVKSMKEKIDLSLLMRAPDTVDVKLGAGGIREIEFFCQALQLIYGGKDPDIRERNTLRAVQKLKEKFFLSEADARTLKEGYVFLRNLEHRIQIVEGRQSQAIPASPNALERLARMMGFKDTEGKKAGEFFWEEYQLKTSSVHSVYRSLFYKEEGKQEIPENIRMLLASDLKEEEAAPLLTGLGFKDLKEAYKSLLLLKSVPPARLGARASVLLQKLTPVFLAKAASSPDPDASLSHLERFIASVSARTAFYSLLAENPPVIDELIRIFGTSVFLSRRLIELPESLDLFLSEEIAIPYRSKKDTFDIVLRELDTLGDYEAKLNHLRRVKNQEVFRIGKNDIAGALSTRRVSYQITFLAEASLEAAYRISFDELSRTYGEPTDSAFFIIGLGKLGSRELIYGSDLDIIFVYSDAEGGMTGGPKSISSHEFFVKLGQRIISALTVRTPEGFVFNVDTRLRPSGSSGPLVVSRSSLLKYHREKTLVWERQAFTRARAVAGDPVFAAGVLKELEGIIYSKSLTKEEISEMLRIRKRMEVEIAKEDSSRYNIKTGKGGIVDIEFLVQALQLKYGNDRPSLRTPLTWKALLRLEREKLMERKAYTALKEAYSFLRFLETRLRIVNDRPEGYLYKDSEETVTLARRAGYTGPDCGRLLLKDYARYSSKVRELYSKTMENP